MKHIIEAKTSAAGRLQVEMVNVGVESAGQRLDNFLLAQLKGVPKSHVYRIIRSGEVRVNKGRADAATRLESGDRVRLPALRRPSANKPGLAAMAGQQTSAREFKVLFEDEAVLALDKPAGLAVHGGSGLSFGVIEQLRRLRPQAQFLELVHRLDRDTSGILLLAKKRSALTALQQQFRERETGKTYLALVAGAWPAGKKVLDQPLHKYLLDDGQRRVKVVARDDPQGKPSLTLVKVRARSERYSLLEVSLKSGRTHQIRVHLASAGWPIVGDDKYGDFALNKALLASGSATAAAPLRRMFLHAWRLHFEHPGTGQRIALSCPLPPDLARFVAAALPAAHDL